MNQVIFDSGWTKSCTHWQALVTMNIFEALAIIGLLWDFAHLRPGAGFRKQ